MGSKKMTDEFINELFQLFFNPDTFLLGVNLLCKECELTIISQQEYSEPSRRIKHVLLSLNKFNLNHMWDVINIVNLCDNDHPRSIWDPSATAYNVGNTRIKIVYEWR